MAHSLVYLRSLRQPQPGAADRLLNTEQVREMLACSRSMVYKLIDQGDLTCVKVGRSVRVPSRSLEAYIARGASET